MGCANLPLPTGEGMAPVVGHAAIAISAVIIRTAAIIDRAAAVIDGAAAIVTIGIAVIISRAVLGRSDRKTGPDNTGKSRCCGSATAAPIEPAASAEVSGVAGRGRRRQAFAGWGGAGGSPPRPRRWPPHCPHPGPYGGAAR